MSQQGRPSSDLYTHVEVNASNAEIRARPAHGSLDEHTELLRDVLSAQDRTNELLEELVGALGSAQKQRVNELSQWKQQNPALAKRCRDAAETLSQVQVQFLDALTEEVNESSADLLDGDFVFNEFVDRFGPRMAHLNSVIQVLAQLSSIPNPTNTNT